MSQDVKRANISLKKDDESGFFVLYILFTSDIEGTDDEIDKFFNKINTIIEKKIEGKFCVIVDFQCVARINYLVASKNVDRIAEIGVKHRERMVKCGAFIKNESIVSLIQKYQELRPPAVDTQIFCNSLEEVWSFIRSK